MIGIITTPIILAVVLLFFSFLVNTLVFNLAARFMDFSNKKWRTSMYISLIVVLFTMLYSLLVTLLNFFSFFTQVLGIAFFVGLIYYLSLKFYKKETKKQRIGFCFFATLFALLLNLGLLLIVSLLNNLFTII